jgi:hypothetical protein
VFLTTGVTFKKERKNWLNLEGGKTISHSPRRVDQKTSYSIFSLTRPPQKTTFLDFFIEKSGVFQAHSMCSILESNYHIFKLFDQKLPPPPKGLWPTRVQPKSQPLSPEKSHSVNTSEHVLKRGFVGERVRVYVL